MDFSLVAQQELTAVAEGPPTQSEPSRTQWGGHWHCPADGESMIEAEGRVVCPACLRQLPPRLIYGLIEFHVHP